MHGTIWLAASPCWRRSAVVAAIVVAARACGAGRRHSPEERPRWIADGASSAPGSSSGSRSGTVEGAVTGDGLFHEARVRKLVDLGTSTCAPSTSSPTAGSIPGYAFPLWHGFLALVAKLSGLDPSVVVQPRGLAARAARAACVAWEAGVAVFGSAGAGIAVVAAALGALLLRRRARRLVRLARAAGDRGAAAPRAGRVALFFAYANVGRRADLAALAAAFGALALVHPTYALFALIPLGA